MDRNQKISELQTYIEAVDKDVTMILQSLQWNRKRLLESPSLVSCRYDPQHRVLPENGDKHEQQCFLRRLGYGEQDELLPDLPDPAAVTSVKLNKDDINKIIDEAAWLDPSFIRGRNLLDPQPNLEEPLPCSLGRLQQTYSQDERRAIHDAVVATAPATHDLADLALVSPTGSQQAAERPKTRVEILAELRDTRRRRAKYRVSGNTKNYSHVLRDVIASQMEVYAPTPTSEADSSTDIRIPLEDDDTNTSSEHRNSETYGHEDTRQRDKDRHTEYDRERDLDRARERSSDRENRERFHRPKDTESRSYEDGHDTRHVHDLDSRKRRYDNKRNSRNASRDLDSKHEKRIIDTERPHKRHKGRENRSYEDDTCDRRYENESYREKSRDASKDRERISKKENKSTGRYDSNRRQKHTKDRHRDKGDSSRRKSSQKYKEDKRYRGAKGDRKSGSDENEEEYRVKVKEEPQADEYFEPRRYDMSKVKKEALDNDESSHS